MLRSAIPLALLTALPLFAQRPLEVPAPPPLLRVLSHDAELLRGLATLFHAEPAAFAFQRDDQYGELVLRHDLTVEQRVASGAMRPDCSSEFLFKPGGFVTAFQTEIAAKKQRFATQLGFVLEQAGFPRSIGAQLLDELLALLPQIGGIYVQVEGDPRHPGNHLTVRLDLAPEPATGFLRYVEKLAPNRDGVPQPPGSDGVLDAQLSLDPTFHYALLQPFLAIAAQYGAATKAQQQEAGDWLDRMLQAWDGAFACHVDGEHMLTLLGLKDQKAFAAVLADPQYRAHQQQSARQRHLDLEFTPDALVHRDCALLQTVSSTPTPNPLLPGGEITSYTGVAGGMALTVGGASIDQDAARRTVDDALDGKFARQPLRDADRGREVPAIFKLSLALDRLPGFEHAIAELPADRRPKRIHLLIYKVGITLKLRLDLR